MFKTVLYVNIGTRYKRVVFMSLEDCVQKGSPVWGYRIVSRFASYLRRDRRKF